MMCWRLGVVFQDIDNNEDRIKLVKLVLFLHLSDFFLASYHL